MKEDFSETSSSQFEENDEGTEPVTEIKEELKKEEEKDKNSVEESLQTVNSLSDDPNSDKKTSRYLELKVS